MELQKVAKDGQKKEIVNGSPEFAVLQTRVAFFPVPPNWFLIEQKILLYDKFIIDQSLFGKDDWILAELVLRFD